MYGITLPLCPTLSRCFTNVRRHGRAKTPLYINWRREAGQLVMASKPGYLDGDTQSRKLPFPEVVTINLILPFIPNGDLDNRFKASLDLLSWSGIITDDRMKYVSTISATYRDSLPRKEMRIEVWPYAETR